MSDYIARVKDELHFVYASGARGVNADYILPPSFTSFAGNALSPVNSATDPEHIMWGGAATSSVGILGTSQQFDVDLLNRIYARANTVGGGVQSIPSLEPLQDQRRRPSRRPDAHVSRLRAAQSDRRRWLGGRAEKRWS